MLIYTVYCVTGNKEEVSREDLFQLALLSMFIKESLRMYPVATSVSKTSQKQMVIDGYVIPKGSMLNIGIYQAHYLEEFWPEPDRFDPYRLVLRISIRYIRSLISHSQLELETASGRNSFCKKYK